MIKKKKSKLNKLEVAPLFEKKSNNLSLGYFSV